ncbi:hypothetical protein CAEBREN_01588 [Caenorhabditis brenneri]|uniref:Uncharacterized protein n=1 Tax=Caenorhabditis brenneri TaxID=135651 RepID=G0N8G6_CAEBE|nr:hypothetical protein CAEBREN_01588 [Caenorhabditis brenneri]
MKHGRPSAEKDKCRCSIAKSYLSHLKTVASIMKCVYITSNSPSCLKYDYDDFESGVIYTLNKNRRWEATESIGVDLLDELNKLNKEWNVTIVERVTLKEYSRSASIYGSCSSRFEEFYPIKKFHFLKNGNEYSQKSVRSVRGQTYLNFLKKKKNFEGNEESEENSDPIASYNVLRAPRNYVQLLKKRFQQSNYGPYYDWPRAGYWNRLNREEDRNIDLRYEEVENLDGEYFGEDQEDAENSSLPSKSNFYNFEDHLVDKFVVIKRRKKSECFVKRF